MKVLFLCDGNSDKSIMAEALLRHHSKGMYDVFSAATEPDGVNPNTLRAIRHFGLKADNLESNHINEYGNLNFDYVITLCNKAAKECKNRINGTNVIAWDIQAPSFRSGSDPMVKILQAINQRIKMFLQMQEKQKPAPINPTAFYKALADDIRLKTLLIITIEKEVCVCELMAALAQESQPKVSRHLAQLRKMGILSDRRHQKWVFYSLNTALPDWMKQAITSTVVNAPNFIEQELARLHQMGERPNRVATYCS